MEAELEKEKQTHLIVAQLKLEIEEWTKKLKEEINMRETITKDLREHNRIKEAGIQRLIQDTFQYEEKITDLNNKIKTTGEDYEEKLNRKERHWLKKAHDWENKQKELRREIEAAVYALNDPEKIRRQKERAEAERALKERMHAQLESQAREIHAAQVAVKEMAEENTELRTLLGSRKGELGKESALLEKKLESQNKRFKRLMVENEDLRQALVGEMDKADKNLKDLELQFLDMPNPFADEVAELRMSYAEAERLMHTLGKENEDLIQELRQVKINAMEREQNLEKKLLFTMEMLEKVRAMETMKLLANADFVSELDADQSGDVTWDEALPIFQAKGLNEREAREFFNKLDLSGDGTISAEEFESFRREALAAQ